MSPPPDSSKSIDERVRDLCDQGLKKFRAGDADGALLDWDKARLLDPHAATPNKYIERVVRGLDPGEDEVPSGIQVSLSGEDAPTEDMPEADEYDIELSADEAEPPPGLGTNREARDAFYNAAFSTFDDLDSGWSLDPQAEALPPPPKDHRAPSSGLDKVPAGVMGVPDDAVDEPDDDEPDIDLLPAAPRADQPAALEELDIELPPMDRHLAQARIGAAETLDLLPRPDLAGEFDDVPPTRDLPRPPPEPEQVHDSDSDITVPGGGGEVPPAGSLNLSEDALKALRPDTEPAPEDTTVERPGMVKRGFALPDLGELDLGARSDDRHEESDDKLQVTFREQTAPGLEDELTTERGAMGAGFDEHNTDTELTVERRPTRQVREDTAELGSDDELTVERGASGARASSVIVEDSLADVPPGGDDVAGTWSEVRERIRTQVAGNLPEGLEGDEHVRHWVSAFIDRARLELDRGNSEMAATALELALSEAPESAAAQKLIHRHRDLLLEIFGAYLGDSSSVPMLAVPMHELGGQELDSRAVFLLSRIDGTFTLEEIVDISGMSAIEAYRHLSRLCLQGILELR